MNPWLILKAEWRRSCWGMLALALVLGLSTSLGLTVSMLERGIRQGAAQAGDAFDLLLGASGSPTQLLLSAVYLQPAPLPLLDYEVFTRVADSAGVSWAAPLAFGDRWQDFPLVGTTEAMVTLGGKRPLHEGVGFSASKPVEEKTGEHEVETPTSAVVGALVPLAVGEGFTPAHGLINLPDGNDAHGHVQFRVSGRLPATGTPWDRAILVPLESVWKAHGLNADISKNSAQGNLPGISAVVVKPAAIADAYKLRSVWQTPTTQAVFTGEVLTDLFATLGDVRALLQSMAGVSQGISLAGVLLATLFAVALRRNTLLLLRTLGAPRLYLMLSVWSLAAGVIVLGVLCGLGLSLVAGHVTAALMQQATATVLPVNLSATEWTMAAVFVAVGLLAAATPAVTIYKNTHMR